MFATDSTAYRPFDVNRADLNIQINFGSQFWPLIHNIPRLYSALLTGMKTFGLGSRAIRTDTGDGSLGDYNVNFWLFDFRAVVKIRLDGAELHCPNLTDSDVEPLERAFIRLAECLSQAQENLPLSSYFVTVNLHGQPEGLSAKNYLAGFVRSIPDQMGPQLGNGVVFYFGNHGPVTRATVTADQLLVPDSVALRLTCLLDGSLRPDELRRTIEAELNAALNGLGLCFRPVSAS